MEILIVTVFVSLVLVVGGLIFFVSRLREGDFDHGERLSLLPLADDTSDDERAAPNGTAGAGDAES